MCMRYAATLESKAESSVVMYGGVAPHSSSVIVCRCCHTRHVHPCGCRAEPCLSYRWDVHTYSGRVDPYSLIRVETQDPLGCRPCPRF